MAAHSAPISLTSPWPTSGCSPSSSPCGTRRSTSTAPSRRRTRPAASLIAEGEIGTYELLVIDDASTDATGRMADAARSADPRVRVVHHPVNRKLGGSLKTGFAEAQGDLVLYTDADLPFDMDEVHKACRLTAPLRGRHRGGVPVRPHGRGLRAHRLLHHLQPGVRWAFGVKHARHQLRLQVVPAPGARHGDAQERGQLHRRRVDRARHRPRASRWFSSASTTSPAPEACRRSLTPR